MVLGMFPENQQDTPDATGCTDSEPRSQQSRKKAPGAERGGVQGLQPQARTWKLTAPEGAGCLSRMNPPPKKKREKRTNNQQTKNRWLFCLVVFQGRRKLVRHVEKPIAPLLNHDKNEPNGKIAQLLGQVFTTYTPIETSPCWVPCSFVENKAISGFSPMKIPSLRFAMM